MSRGGSDDEDGGSSDAGDGHFGPSGRGSDEDGEEDEEGEDAESSRSRAVGNAGRGRGTKRRGGAAAAAKAAAKATKAADRATAKAAKLASKREDMGLARSHEEVVLDYIIERKTVGDLAASIGDGRLLAQATRLMASGLRVTYLVEGDPQHLPPNPLFSAKSITTKHVVGAMVEVQVKHGFRVLSTNSTDATVDALAAMHRAISEQFFSGLRCQRQAAPPITRGAGSGSGVCATAAAPVPAPSLSSARSTPGAVCPNDRCVLWGRAAVARVARTYDEWVPTAELPRRLSVVNTFGRALRQIYGCSDKKASAVLELYPTPSALFSAYARLPYPMRDGPTMLQDLQVPGNAMKIGPAVSKGVFNVIYGNTGQGGGAAGPAGFEGFDADDASREAGDDDGDEGGGDGEEGAEPPKKRKSPSGGRGGRGGWRGRGSWRGRGGWGGGHGFRGFGAY